MQPTSAQDSRPEHSGSGDQPATPLSGGLARLVFAILVLASANYAAGRLGLLLAIPPGFATAVFPPSGIALAAVLLWGPRLVPGVVLGSLCFNLHLSLDSTAGATLLGAAPVALCIALGSGTQALFAAALVRRSVRAPTLLVHEADVIRLLVFGGPIGCLVSASWGVGTLAGAGLVAEGSLFYTWFTWWVGDTIGVLIFTPLVLTLFARPRSVWWPRLRSVGLPLCVAFALVVGVYSVVSKREEGAIASGFQRRVELLDRALYRDLETHTEVLWSIQSFFAASNDVDPREFETFVRRSLAAHPGLRALSWNPLVRGEERGAYEARSARRLGRAFELRARDASGRLVPAPASEAHVVVQYISPLEGNETALGFDVMSERNRRSALIRARDGGGPAASERIELVQSEGDTYGFLLFLPIYVSDQTPSTLEQRRALVRGFAVAVLEVEALIEAAFESLPTQGVSFRVLDGSAPAGARLLGQHPRGADMIEPDRFASRYRVVTNHHVGGRDWAVHFWPTPEYLAGQPSWRPWAVLASGLTFTGLLGALLLVVTGRAVLEAERRAELAEVNHRLELTNEELARFAYAASHDLRSPLRGVSQLAEFMMMDHGDALPEAAREQLEMIQARVGRMARLLDDLLEYARVGWMERKPEFVDTAAMVEEIAALTSGAEHFAVRLVDMPEILTERVPLHQVLQNLFANAINHHDRESGEIEFSCRAVGADYEFTVRDDGPGIAPGDRERVFEMFESKSQPGKTRGSGMGLALVRKIVRNRGGEVEIVDEGGRGTMVRFRWPKAARGAESASIA